MSDGDMIQVDLVGVACTVRLCNGCDDPSINLGYAYTSAGRIIRHIFYVLMIQLLSSDRNRSFIEGTKSITLDSNL